MVANALEKLYFDEIVPCIQNGGLCATVLTQVSDVEDETNGLVTYDRQIKKFDLRLKEVCSKLYKGYLEVSKQRSKAKYILTRKRYL